MPIKDLQQQNKPGLARAGIIRLGYKQKKNGKEYPVPADHFVLKDAPGVAEALGNEKPASLRIYFPFNEVEQVFPAFHQYWVASALLCRGDGESILYAVNPYNGQTIVRDGIALVDFESKGNNGKSQQFAKGQAMPCPGMLHDLYPKCASCKPNAMLIVLLRDVPRLAYYQIATTSIHNIVNLTEQLTYIKQTVGRLQGVPFILRLAPRKISVPKGDGKGRMRVEKYLLSLEVDPEWVRSLLDTQRQLAEPERALLPESTEEVIEGESQQVSQSTLAYYEPPVWMPPNGGDDSDLQEDGESEDWQDFVKVIKQKIPYFETEEQVAQELKIMELFYDPENEDFLIDQLAISASQKADHEASEGELSF